jgi:hypothetical protein
MKISRTDAFKREFQKLPDRIKRSTEKALRLLVTNPHHPSLRVKKVKGELIKGFDNVFEARICKWEPKNDPLWEPKRDPPLGLLVEGRWPAGRGKACSACRHQLYAGQAEHALPSCYDLSTGQGWPPSISLWLLRLSLSSSPGA